MLPDRLLIWWVLNFSPRSNLVSWEQHVPSSRRKKRHWCPSYYVKQNSCCKPSKLEIVNCVSSNWSGQCKQLLYQADGKCCTRARHYFSNLFLGENPKTPVKNKKQGNAKFQCQRALKYCFRISDQLLDPVLIFGNILAVGNTCLPWTSVQQSLYFHMW